ncbi:hypothetical protein B0T16DRAFT_389705 [Cercophora newfieldiana]|uniref:Uncharacterized protein n=1 Tax=Cercophora newfieldiana TaxID=92897 RepID=A0AA40CT45_9PEZI|nr:hypothetical protein B0T16DRAFT_389705 [Cercophora newfieldiana]
MRPKPGPKSTGGTAPGPNHTGIICHKTPFAAHDGSPAAMASWNGLSETLPYLYTFAFYITNPDMTGDSFDSAAFYERCLLSGHYLEPFRFDFYFLPNASIDDCKAHYMAEKAARGPITVQIEAVVRKEPPKNEGGLPGMVPSYLSLPEHWYHDLLVVCDGDWEVEGMQLVQFNLPAKGECGVYEEELGDWPPVMVRRLDVGKDGYYPDTIQRKLFEIISHPISSN